LGKEKGEGGAKPSWALIIHFRTVSLVWERLRKDTPLPMGGETEPDKSSQPEIVILYFPIRLRKKRGRGSSASYNNASLVRKKEEAASRKGISGGKRNKPFTIGLGRGN